MLRSLRYKTWVLLRASDLPKVRMEKQYGIRPGYRHRLDNEYFNAHSASSENWQVEVYEYARQLAESLEAQTICDMGCGSGYKLLKYFPEYKKIGIDVKETVKALNQRYPDDAWLTFDDAKRQSIKADLVVSADAIEHVPNPDVFVEALYEMHCQNFVISTPDLGSLYGFDHGGPPANKAHCREWTYSEFADYLSRWFDIIDHRISNKKQCTQLIYAKKRA